MEGPPKISPQEENGPKFKSPEKKYVTPRTYDAYLEDFCLPEGDLVGKRILDIGSGLSNFTKVANEKFKESGTMAVPLDPVYASMGNDFGEFKENIAEANMEFKPIGIDVNPVSPDFFPKRIYAGVKEGENKVAGSHQHLPFAKESFDLVLAHNSILQYEDWKITQNAINEIVGILKQNGEIRIIPSDLISDGGESFFMRKLGPPTPERIAEAERLGLRFDPERESIAMWKQLEERGHTIYAALGRNVLQRRRTSRMMGLGMPPTYSLIIRNDSQIPHLENAIGLKKLSFKNIQDGFRIPYEDIRIAPSEDKK